jgi:GT2 family glycosyltransferase
VISGGIADVPIIIVGFRNSGDIKDCLTALSRAAAQPRFDIFICENGGLGAYRRLIDDLSGAQGPCERPQDQSAPVELETSRFLETHRLKLRTRGSNVWVGRADSNLGYAGGINAWLLPLLRIPGWKGIWILNPDTQPAPDALLALTERAEKGGKGMVGSTILDTGDTDQIRFRGGISWQRFRARGKAIGLGDRLDGPHDLPAIESAMACPSGSSMFVTRPCIEKIGPMDESFFLFFEDLDWGVRAKAAGLGYASKSIVGHKRGTSTGSAKSPAAVPKLVVYLEHRNGIRFVRKHFPLTLPVRIAVSLLYATRFLIAGAPHNCVAALEGVYAGLRGEIGRPPWHRDTPGDSYTV